MPDEASSQRRTLTTSSPAGMLTTARRLLCGSAPRAFPQWRAFHDGSALDVLDGSINTSSAEYKENMALMDSLTAELQGHIERVKLGGGEKYVEKHVARNKMVARDRIDSLLDQGSPFLELSPLAGYELYEGPTRVGDVFAHARRAARSGGAARGGGARAAGARHTGHVET